MSRSTWALLVAGTKYRGEFEERLKKLMDEIKQNDDIILVRGAEGTIPDGTPSSLAIPTVVNRRVMPCRVSEAVTHSFSSHNIILSLNLFLSCSCPFTASAMVRARDFVLCHPQLMHGVDPERRSPWTQMIDEVHTLIGAGAAEGAIDAANILKPALARGELQCIGATTLDEYRKHIEKDPALERWVVCTLHHVSPICGTEDSQLSRFPIWKLDWLSQHPALLHRLSPEFEAVDRCGLQTRGITTCNLRVLSFAHCAGCETTTWRCS